MLLAIETISGDVIHAGIKPPELEVRQGGELPPISIVRFTGHAATMSQLIYPDLHDVHKDFWAEKFTDAFDGLDDVRLLPEETGADSGPDPFFRTVNGNVRFLHKGSMGHTISQGDFLKLTSKVFEDISSGSQPAISPAVLAAADIIRQTIKQ